MKTLYKTKIEAQNIPEGKYDMLIDFLEANNFDYEETEFEEYTIDERTEEEKYEDWLSEQANIKYEETKLGI